MEFKGTKGKWIVSASTDYSDVIMIRGEQYAPSFNENKYNAQLVSKAPEMLEMLKNIQSETDPHGNSKRWNEIQQLIKEATEL